MCIYIYMYMHIYIYIYICTYHSGEGLVGSIHSIGAYVFVFRFSAHLPTLKINISSTISEHSAPGYGKSGGEWVCLLSVGRARECFMGLKS